MSHSNLIVCEEKMSKFAMIPGIYSTNQALLASGGDFLDEHSRRMNKHLNSQMIGTSSKFSL